MDDNPFEIPPLMSSTGLVGNGKENTRTTTKGAKKTSSPTPSFQRQYRRLRHHDPNKQSSDPILSSHSSKSATSPRWKGKFSSSLASPGVGTCSDSIQSIKDVRNTGSKPPGSSQSLRSLYSSACQNRHPSPQSRQVFSLSSASPASTSLPESISKCNTSSTSKPGDAVLRRGETMDGFFSITKDSSDDYVRLVDSLVNGSRSKDSTTWRRVLEMASRQHQPNVSSLYPLIRMHRRATMRFPLEHQDLSKMSDHRQRNDVMKLWVSYAQTHAKDGNLEEARNTFHHIENKSKGLYDLLKDDDFLGKFFLAFARFELEHYRDKESAKQILLRGIQDTKDADGALLDYLKKMDGSTTNSPILSAEKSTKRSPLALTKNAVTSIHSSHEYSPGISSSSGPNKSPLEFSLSSGGNNLSQKKRSVEVGRSRSPKRHKPQNMINKPEIGMHVTVRPAVGVGVKANDSSSPKGKAAVVTATETGLHGKPPAPTSKKRSSITSRLARKGLTGAPKRVEADTTMALHDDVSTDDSDQESTCEEDTKVPSFKNMDLSYIWTWKPKGLTNTERQEVSMGGEHPTHGSGNSSNHSGAEAKLEENDTQSKKEKEALKKTSALKETEPSYSENAVACNNTTSTGQMKAVTSATSAVDGSLARKETLLAKANLEFLPLVHEDNILRIKTDSYVKLGVIGKGGSCKVYRALTKKCTVVAIKKVKLEGMTKKQIEGYANEISLLKRLKGNPSIIRMYDSELDLQRKSLFVVMELGEVDLNYVLQQRARAETSKSLDMNFIRLTWQQMLGAVHSIHEAKIIHSDLKPANFLFVRGALKLIDFGIAKAIANPEDTTKIVRESQIGTLNYMSPESILDTGEGGEAGPRMKIGRASDVWSLGCILYEMVYGTTPFASYHFIVKLQAIINEDHKIKFPDAAESGEAAIDAMKQCLRRRPEERPPIVGKNGLLNEHWFLHSKRKARK